jgi:hypothetical protein
MVIRPWEMVHTTVDFRVGIACALCAKLEYCPVVTVFAIEEGNELVRRVAIGFLGPY